MVDVHFPFAENAFLHPVDIGTERIDAQRQIVDIVQSIQQFPVDFIHFGTPVGQVSRNDIVTFASRIPLAFLDAELFVFVLDFLRQLVFFCQQIFLLQSDFFDFLMTAFDNAVKNLNLLRNGTDAV